MPRKPKFQLAPLKTGQPKAWEGDCRRKPWNYQVTAVIPELDTPAELMLAVELLRLQTVKPFVLIIDTGSTPENFARVEALRAPDLEVHAIRLNGVLHPSEFVTAAMDLAFSICRTEHLFCTHSDCFLRRRNFVADLLRQCSPQCPAVGYEMTPRTCPPPVLCDWQGILGHSATMLHMPSMDLLGAGWSMRRWAVLRHLSDQRPIPGASGWPDTEVLLGHILREAGIEPKIIGREKNFERTLDRNIDHCRSLAGSQVYSKTYYKKAKRWAADAKRQARARIARWRREAKKHA